MSEFTGRVVVITGAGSGIGRALALDLAAKGARLALSDVDTVGLEETARLARDLGAEVQAEPLDVTQREKVMDYADKVAEHFGVVNQVYNNAGVAYHGEFERTEFKDFERVVDVDFWGVVNGTKAFLPHLIASGDGHLINVSSLFGLLSIPGQSAYNAAKFAVRGFTESLRQEMLVAKHPVQVTCVHPGGIKTAIARNAAVPDGDDQVSFAQFFDSKLARTTPEDAAATIVRGVRKNKGRVLIGADAKLLDGWVRLVGPSYQRVVAFVTARVLPKG
ncbi:SDR family NAD(P)-dependent oxidoreductase [Rhodococcus artemisiae]|uniref:SDR family NAD(P)-dependent oxidoreductase n=1 Tax=Rhodococcus artemisiae TaxID=714159 RepID=A0ABU7LHZ2_9NOCA|nr:SDR family NAD(P)-dependent oxidoreductase [Rhodococcus artemisiae]MEE2061170.1 SDR family NAD(P)-dependent oxidoreductase [Rhodococcus artemisiae]